MSFASGARRLALILCGAGAITPAAWPQAPGGPPSPTTLAEITRRGRLIAGYDRAAWHASDSVHTFDLPPGTVGMYLAEQVGGRWAVRFGVLDTVAQSFQVMLEASPAGSETDFAVRRYDPPLRSDADLPAARAVVTARAAFGEQSRPYNHALLTNPDSSFFVYLYPAPRRAGRTPLGGDVRYRVSPDGAKILETRPLHHTILEQPPPPPGAAYGMHSAVVDDLPEDTDVAYVLTRQPRLPEIVVTRRFSYRINLDGTIEVVERR